MADRLKMSHPCIVRNETNREGVNAILESIQIVITRRSLIETRNELEIRFFRFRCRSRKSAFQLRNSIAAHLIDLRPIP